MWKLWNQLKNIKINRVFQQDITFYTERVPLRFTCISRIRAALCFALRRELSWFFTVERTRPHLSILGRLVRSLSSLCIFIISCIYEHEKKKARALLAPFLKANWTHKQYKKEKTTQHTTQLHSDGLELEVAPQHRAAERCRSVDRLFSISHSIFDYAHVACSNFNALKSLSCEWITLSDPIQKWSIRFDIWLKISNLIFSWHDRVLSMTQRAQKPPFNISKSERVMFS